MLLHAIVGHGTELRTLSLEFTLILTIIYLCDSIHTLNLTINNSSTSSSTVTVVIVLIGMVRLIQVQVHILGLVQIVLDVIALQL